MILIDSNIPMYLVGVDHPHRVETQRALERAVVERRRLVTDAEVLQEILHRFAAIRRRDLMQVAFDVLLGLVDEVLPIVESDVVAAKDLLGTHPKLSARDALHAAVMHNHAIAQILSFDRGFEAVAGVERIPSASS